ncbi:MAG: hypothetical protein AAF666_04785, partial [Pseudomonadota bacterium]
MNELIAGMAVTTLTSCSIPAVISTTEAPGEPVSAASSAWSFQTPETVPQTSDDQPFDRTVVGRSIIGDPSGLSSSSGHYEVPETGVSVYAESLKFAHLKYGMTLRQTGEVYVHDFEFSHVSSVDRFGGALRIGGSNKPTVGITYLENVYADGGDVPSADYAEINTDFLTNERNNAPVYLRYVTARNFSDGLIDNKSTVYISNATLEDSYRELRAHNGATIIIVNSVVNSNMDETIAWLGGESARIYYYNVLWNGQEDPDPAWIQGWDKNGNIQALSQVIALDENPLPQIDDFFSGRVETVSFDLWSDNGWIPLDGGKFGTVGEALAGDVVFDLSIPGESGTIRSTVTETLADGTSAETVSSAAVYAGGSHSVDLFDFGSLPVLSLAAPREFQIGTSGQDLALTITVSLDEVSPVDVVAELSISGSPTGPDQVTVPAGQLSVDITLNAPRTFAGEDDELITVELTNIRNAADAEAPQVSAWIIADDEPPPVQPVTSMQTGTETRAQSSSDEWHSVSFEVPIDNAVVVMGALTLNDPEAATVRVRNVTDTGFEFQIDEWDYQDGIHGTESVSWMAMSAGTYALQDGRVITAGRTTSVKETFSTIQLDAFSDAPVVIAQVASDNDGAAVTTRIRNIKAESFQLQMQEEEAASGGHAEESVHYLAVEVGSGAGLTAAVTPDVVTDAGYSMEAGDAFFFVAGMQTRDGSDAATLRYAIDGQARTYIAQEEQSKDMETRHTSEVIGWIETQQVQIDLLVL